MPSAVSPNPRAVTPTAEEIDNLFNYDDAVDDFLKDLPINNDNHGAGNTTPPKNIDDEITIKKKRKPVPKLDEALLLSDKGLPKLRKITKSRVKFRGKGHEFSDMGMLLDTYQLWLDELFPRAKFRDALSMVEKLGHSKAMQMRRRAWLDGTKPHAKSGSPEPEKDGEFMMSGGLGGEGAKNGAERELSPVFPVEVHANEHAVADRTAAGADDEPDEDELDALLAESDQTSKFAAPQQRRQTGPFQDDVDDDDDLDALMAEQSVDHSACQKPSQQKGPFQEDADDDQDELDALMAEQETATTSQGSMPEKSVRVFQERTDNDFADDEEAMAGLEMW